MRPKLRQQLRRRKGRPVNFWGHSFITHPMTRGQRKAADALVAIYLRHMYFCPPAYPDTILVGREFMLAWDVAQSAQ